MYTNKKLQMNLNRKSIEQGPGRFLVKAKDPFLTEDFLLKFQDIFKDYQYVRCDEIESFVDVCSSDTLFGADKRIVVLMMGDIDKDALSVILEIAERKTDDILILIETDSLLKTKPYTQLKTLCTAIDLKEPTESEKAVWVKKWLTEKGLKYPDELPGYIVSYSGADLLRLKNEIKKLALLMSYREDKNVTKELCNEIIGSNRESQPFVFIDNFFRKKISDVLNEFRKVDEYSYVKLLHFIIGQIERVYKVAIYKEQGLSADQIGEILGVPVFIVKNKLFTSISFYGKIKLLQLLDLMNKLDVELRTTKYPKDTIFESYLLKAYKT